MIFTFIVYLQSGTEGGDATGVVCCGGIILIIVIAVLIGNSANKQRAQALAAARDNYHQSLIRLKANPTDADLRQTTLALGRTYSNLTRNNKGVTIFDEVALANDISAACGGATTITENKGVMSNHTIENRLMKLAELRATGLIDEAEYATRRRKILDEV